MRLSADQVSLLRARQAERGGPRPRLPEWLRAPLPGGARYAAIKARLRARGLHTVCEEAQCPNIGECWNEGTATIMLLGDTCTRTCRFCAVRSGPHPPPPDPAEPDHAARQVEAMALDYVVLTSVNRDDLPDGGAGHFAAAVAAIRALNPATLIEVLTPDFAGRRCDVATVVAAGPDVFAHNVETVESLQRALRDRRASFDQSLQVLAAAKAAAPALLTKSSLMLGAGETDAEVDAALVALRAVDCDAVTLGQYLRPSPWHHPVARFVPPEEFDHWRLRSSELGFRYCASGPLVRSSYRAGEHYLRGLAGREGGNDARNACNSAGLAR